MYWNYNSGSNSFIASKFNNNIRCIEILKNDTKYERVKCV